MPARENGHRLQIEGFRQDRLGEVGADEPGILGIHLRQVRMPQAQMGQIQSTQVTSK